MTRLSQLLHLDDGEFPALRAQIEAKPIPAPPAPKPLGSGRSAIAYLAAVAPVDGPVSRRSRYSVAALIPAGRLAVVPLPDAAETVIAEVRAAMANAELPLAPGIRNIGRNGGRWYTNGRDARGRFAQQWEALKVTVTARGHWYRSDDPRDPFSNDTVCRGCGHTGHFDYILDYKECTHPATNTDIVRAFTTPAPTAKVEVAL